MAEQLFRAQRLEVYMRHQASIAAVLNDMKMPVMDGAGLITALRRINPKVPIILASGPAESDQMARVSNGGATTFLSKPYRAEVMLQALAEALGAATASEQTRASV